MISSLAPGSEVGRFARALLAARRVEQAGRAAVTEVQRERLRGVLEAAQRTPLYGGRIPRSAITSARIDDITPVGKSEFLERLDETFPDGGLARRDLHAFIRDPRRVGELLSGRYLVAMTSGTTGQVGIFVNDLESWSTTRAITFARIFRDRLGPLDFVRFLAHRRYRMSFVVASGGHYMTYLLASRVPPLGRLVTDARVHSVELPVPVLVDELNAQRPHLLHTYPTILELLCLEIRTGRLRIDPDVITAGSEPLTASCRAAVAEAFPRAQLVETYAATECVPLATACRYGHLHVNEDACILEPIDADGAPVPSGTLGEKLWVTNLLNTVQPLVRYTLTDQVRLLDEPCPCGAPFRRIEVHGRTDDTFFLASEDGSFQAHPPIPLELVFLRIPGLLQYQLVHEAQNQLRVLFVAEPGVPGQQVAGVLDAQLSRYLADHGLFESVSYSLEEIDRIERHAESKKVRQILSRVPRPTSPAKSAHALRERRRVPRIKEPS